MRIQMKQKIAWILTGAMLLAGISSGTCFAGDRFGDTTPVRKTEVIRYDWTRSISEDSTDGDYFTKNLGMDQVSRQSVIRTIQDNWKDGLRYGEAEYYVNHENAAGCINYGTEQYEGRDHRGYGFNCTGFVASVLYYANGGTREDALSQMNEIYLPLKQARSRGSQRSFTDGTGWYYYLADGKQQVDGSEVVRKSMVYYMGEVKDPDSIQAALTEADRAGKLKEGYLLYFWPTSGWDCHLGIYAGQDGNGVHQMYHAAGRGNHNGVRLTEPVTLSQVSSEGASDLYIVPLPEAMTGWQEVDGKKFHYYENGKMTRGWYQENNQWYYFDPVTGEMVRGLREMGENLYYFHHDGKMARYLMLGMMFFGRDGRGISLRRE